MATSRGRSNRSIGAKISEVEAQLQAQGKSTSKPHLFAEDIEEAHLAENSVSSRAIAPDAITSEHLARGSVGTENLGIVNEINSDGSLAVNVPEGNIYLSGTEYTVPPGNVKTLSVDDEGMVFLGSGGGGGVTISDTAPLSPSVGDLWFDSTNGNTYIYYSDVDSTQWVGFGGGSSGYILGTIYPWATNTVPSWGLELNGQAVSRTTYSGLFAILGTTYGVGDGSTTFNLPDYRGDTLVGHDTTQTEFDVVGETGGVKSVTLTEAQMPSHTHIQNSHTHGTLNGTGAFIRTGTSSQNNANWVGTGASFGYDTSTGSATATNQNTGGGQAHTNLQPYAVVKWIICAATSAGEFDSAVQTALVGRVGVAEADIIRLETRESFAKIIPTSVSVGSGSGSFSSTTGVVTFSGSTSVSLNGVFTSEFTNYMLIINVTSTSADTGMFLRFGVGTTDDVTNYAYSYAERAAAGAWVFETGNTRLRYGRAATGGSSGRVTIFDPFSSGRKTMIEGTSMDNGGYQALGSGLYNTNRSHTRLTLIGDGTATLTGTLQLIGMVSA